MNLVWERPEPPSRAAPTPLSRDAIVRAAVTLADREGLESVSLRKVAAALDAGPMRLYGYLSTKEELLDLMVDAAYAEMALPRTPEDWRDALRTLARGTRSVALRHEWLADLLGGRPHLGPHALAHLEASLAAFAGVADIDTAWRAVGTLDSYLVGVIRREVAEHRTGQNEQEWQAATGPYLTRMLATGRYPTLARAVQEAGHPDPDTAFESGLAQVLTGIEATLRN